MSFGDFIAEQFPNVQHWTGGSNIHRSLAGELSMPSPGGDIQHLMAAVHSGAMGVALWNFLHERFGDMDWLVTAEEFRAIILVDIYRHLMGEGDTKEPTKIRNPKTGNIFHRLATRGEIVGGVRIWHNGDLRFGFRFRLARMTPDDHKNVPITARQKAISSIKIAEKVVQDLKLAEPTMEEAKKIRQSVHVK